MNNAWHPASQKPDTDKPVTAVIAYYDDGTWFIAGIYAWRHHIGWRSERTSETPRYADYVWALEEDLLATIPPGINE